MPRVDVEGSLLCDVLPDGTVVGQALVEAVYDTSSGDRVGTRTVDPVTGAAYTVQGTLTDCAATDGDCGQVIGTLCYQEPATQDPSFTLHKFNAADPNHPGCLVGLDAMDGDFPFIQYNDPITAWEGTYTSNTGTASNVEVSAPELGGFIDWSTFSPPIPSVPNAGIPAPYTGTAVFNGVTVTLEVFTASAITTGSQYLRMGGTEHFKLSFSSPVTMRFATQGFADPAPGNDERFCGVTATGVVTGAGEIRTAYGLRDCTTGETTWLDQITGDQVDLTTAVVVPCPQQQECASPTEPTATVGLCLADGTPIAVTVIRDCAGTVTSEGWLNLTTGAYSAGAPPAGTVACGDSRSIQVSGTFCAVDDATEDVVALVLVEYTYDDTGAISAVRLVDAVTGTTYVPPAGVTVTVCPAGVEQPERDLVQLCDTATDGTVTPFVRDYARDENGAITGHSDYLLDGTAYTPTGTVGVCASPCLNCETLQLCDITPGPDAWATVTGQAASETLANGITVTWTRTLAGGGVVPDTNMRSWIPNAAGATSSLSTSKPAQVRIGVSLAAGQQLTLPPGSEIKTLSPHHTYDPATRVLTADATSAMTGDASATANAASHITHLYLPRVAGAVQFTAATNGVGIGFDNIEAAAADPYPFLRTVCRGCDGAVLSSTDTELDGTTAYTVVGEAGACQPVSCQDCETLLLCDYGADNPARITGIASSGTLPNGTAWTSTNPGNTQPMPSRYTNGDGAWWGLHVFPNPVAGPTRWTFSRPSVVEFSIYIPSSTPPINAVQLPAALEVVHLPDGYSYDSVTGVLTRTATGSTDPCTYVTDPQIATTARFRTPGPVTSYTTQPHQQSRIAACGTFITYWSGAIEVIPTGQFLRHLCRNCDGTVATVTDTLLDGTTAYVPVGPVGQCETGAASSADPEACHNTTTVLLCAAPADGTTDVTPTITDSNVAAIGQTQFQNHPGPYTPLWTGGTLIYPAGPGPAQQHLAATGQLGADVAGCEDAAGTLTVSVRVRNDGPDDGQAWDGALRLFRGTTQIAAHNALEWAPVGWQGTLTVSAPVTAAEVAAGDIRVSVQLETYHLGAKQWTADQFTASLALEGCALTTPVQILRNVVTDCETGEVVATYDTTLDGEPYDVGTGEVSQCQPATQPQEPDCCPTSETAHLCHTSADGTVVTEFVRDYHRDATGIITGYRDYTLDGADFVPDPTGTVGQCRPVDCTSTPLCVRPSGVVEFISNADNNTTGAVDPVWKWSLGSLAGPWYDMYQVDVFPGWTVTDPGTPGGTAHWVSQHPDRGVDNTGLPGEGPSMTPATPDWYARASFDLPSFADPATIQVASTVLNADQLAVEWRLNAGPWQPVNSAHNSPPYTFGPATVPGAQAGTNTLYLHGRETVFGSGASGVMMHLVVTYDVDATAFEQWLRTTCSDGTITYLDGDGNPQAGVPADSTIVPCPGSSGGGFDVETWPLCILDSTGAVVQHVRAEQVYDTAGVATGAPRLVDAVTGDPATIPAGGSVTVCPSSTTTGPVLTGARSTTGTAPVDLAAEFPGLQSVTLLVSSGSVLVTLTDGTDVPIPAGANVTWSVTRDQDAALDAASFTGADAGTTFLLLWTYTA